MKLSDDKNDVTIESAVVFNSVCELLLKKCGRDFITDDEAVEAWQELIARSRFDITLKRHKVNLLFFIIIGGTVERNLWIKMIKKKLCRKANERRCVYFANICGYGE